MGGSSPETAFLYNQPDDNIYVVDKSTVAESVKIGDPLTLVVSIDNQDIYGMHITDCVVRDGLGWSEQQLINDEG